MAKLALNDLSLRSIKPPPKGQCWYWDESLSGFGVRVSQGGSKTFVLNRKNTTISIGRYPIVGLAAARKEAKRLLAEFTLGKVRPQTVSCQEAIALFLDDKGRAKRERTVKDYERLLNRFGFKGRLTDINHAEAARKLNRITAPSERSHMLVAGKVFFNWCIKRRYITENPFLGLSKPKTVPRTRVLTDDELRALWKAEGPFADYVKLLLLTAQRRGELHHAILEGDTFLIPAHIAKNGREHRFPATELALKFWRQFPEWSWGYHKDKLDDATGVTGWVLHDVRRTTATRMAELGVAPHIIERLLNHVTGSLSQIAQVYNKASYLHEMRTALHSWETHLQALLELQ